MRGFLALPVATLFLLAGCSSGPEDGEEIDPEAFEEFELTATDTKGLIRGVVVDDAIRPIGGAKVTLMGAAPQETTSSEEGLFGFDDLDPGTYFLSASRLGYKGTQISVDVVAGVQEPPIARILMVADASFVAPYYEQFVFEGFIECSTGAAAGGGYAYLSACSASEEAFPNDRFATSYVLANYPDWTQSEMVWESTQSVSQSLAHNFHYEDPEELDGQKDLTVEGTSPLTNTMDNATTKEYIEGLDFAEGDELQLQIRVFTRATDGTGPALTFQQRFTVYTTLFYGYTPPEGWTLYETGEVPPPPS